MSWAEVALVDRVRDSQYRRMTRARLRLRPCEVGLAVVAEDWSRWAPRQGPAREEARCTPCAADAPMKIESAEVCEVVALAS